MGGKACSMMSCGGYLGVPLVGDVDVSGVEKNGLGGLAGDLIGRGLGQEVANLVPEGVAYKQREVSKTSQHKANTQCVMLSYQ